MDETLKQEKYNYSIELDLTRAGINILNIDDGGLIYYEFQYSTPGGGVKWSKQVYQSNDFELYRDSVDNIIHIVSTIRQAMLNGVAE